ncbi:cytochrome P450, partial [Paraphoma chrysanthemicola]
EPLYCLRDSKEHVWINLVFRGIKSIGILNTRTKNPIFAYIDSFKAFFQDMSAVNSSRSEFFRLANEKVTRRLEKGTDRPDFFSYIMKNQESDAKALTRGEMDSNAFVFLVAGSETTATTLSGATYLLLTNPEKYAKLVDEIRSSFSKASEITHEAVNKLDYLIACLQETLRFYPPIPTGFPRIVPVGGDHISGHFIPAGTSVYVSQHATNHSKRNYTDPNAYVPERWLGDEKYKDDNRETLNPFSFGPRNCLGKNLAYAALRLTLAKVLFSFNLELVNKKQNWIEQQVFTVWEKAALDVKVTAVQR